MSKTRIAVPAFLAACFVALPASATSMRCGGKVILEGSTRFEVIEHCGEPDHREDNRWYYRHQGQNSVFVLHFSGDSVSLIKKQRR